MTTKEDILNHIEWYKQYYKINQNPIFEILLFKNVDEYPNIGCEDHPGFYYELDTAIQAMNENWSDIQDHAFHSGLILCHFPGMYQCAVPDARMYFVWDKEKEGFFQQEEPKSFEHIAF